MYKKTGKMLNCDGRASQVQAGVGLVQTLWFDYRVRSGGQGQASFFHRAKNIDTNLDLLLSSGGGVGLYIKNWVFEQSQISPYQTCSVKVITKKHMVFTSFQIQRSRDQIKERCKKLSMSKPWLELRSYAEKVRMNISIFI